MRSRAFLLRAGYSKDRPARPQRAKTRRVSDFGELNRAAHRGWAGEKGDFVSILLKNHRPLRSIAKRAMVTRLGQYLFSYLIIKILPPTCPGCK